MADLSAQQPTAATVDAKVRENPELVAKVRAAIANGRLTADQLRARLHAAGYPDSLLDRYLSDTTGGGAPLPADSIATAIRALGLADSSDFYVPPLQRIDSLADSAVKRAEVPVEDSLPVFGFDVFRTLTNRFEPNLAGGVGPDYHIGPGDVLAVILTGETERTYSLEVTHEGFVLVPQVGQVYVANLTVSQANDVLFNRLRQSYASLSRSPNGGSRLYVTVARLHTNQVFVIGEVRFPGNYRLSSVATVLTALYAAGGPNDGGTLRKVQVRRGASLIGTIDLYDYFLHGDTSHDLTLQSGDVVFVGTHGGHVSIRGPVVRPAVYELVPGESLADLIAAAGGFRVDAAQQRLLVRRVLPPEQRTEGGRDRIVLDVPPSQFVAGSSSPFLLRPGDRVEVFSISAPERTAITVSGDVWNPGTQGFRPGMTLSQALRGAGGVRPDVYLGQVLISRLESDRTRRSIHAALQDSLGTVVNDIALQEDDVIRVYSREAFAPERYVAITGAVRKAGRYAYRSGMTVRELLLLAGGPLESADLREAEIARFPVTRAHGELAQTFRVPLDSSYLFERRQDGSYSGPPGVAFSGQKTPEVLLNPYDNVLIFRQPEWELLGTVAIVGEVRYPGSYTLKNTSERLSELIARAGGLTDKADPDGLLFVRRADSAGRIGVDLRSILKNRKARDNFVLERGDSVEVATYKPYVKVTGAVNSPVAAAYIPGASMEYYIAAAGGPTRKADVDHSFVRQPNGNVESRRRRLGILPSAALIPKAGATITVPERDVNDKTDYASLATALTPLVATALTIITILVRK